MTEQERRKVTLTMDPELHRELRVAAAEDDRAISEMIEEAVRAYLDNRRHPTGTKTPAAPYGEK